MKKRKLEKEQYKIKTLPNEILPEIEGLLNINLKFLGEGTFSKIYKIQGKDAVLKITKDTNEILIFKKIKENNLKNLPKIYSIKKYKDYFIVIMERLYVTSELKDNLKIIFGTKLSLDSDQFDIQITQYILNNIIDKKLFKKFKNLINDYKEIYISTFFRSLGFSNELLPWTKEYKKNKKEINFITKNFTKDEIRIILKLAAAKFGTLEEKLENYINDIILSIDDLLSIGVFHVDIAIRNIMERKDEKLILIDYNLAFSEV